MTDSGFVKLYRKIQSSPMYRALNAKQRDVMIQCLILANHSGREWEWKGEVYKCEPGQFITSLDSLKKVCASDVNTQSIRTAISKLEKWQFLTNESTKTGRLITIINWGTYQGCDKKATKQPTKNQQRANKELTTNKNVKNVKNIYTVTSQRFHEYQSKQLGEQLVSLDEKTINAGADTLRKISEIDGFDFEEEIKPALHWAVQDEFWSGQIRSLASLRRKGSNGEMKFKNLYASYKRNQPKKQKVELVY